MNRNSKEIFLTFDDGPVPGITEKVLDILDHYKYKATFFMVGHNVTKYPALAKEVLAAGHKIGNHTYHHIRGNKNSTASYFADFINCQETILKILDVEAKSFRPPYGRILSEQAKEISRTHQIVMWDVLSGDYDLGITTDKIIKKTKKYTQNGSIIVFHDQQKTADRLPEILSSFLSFTSDQGFLPVSL
ncbi:MAG TPA: polysaccharide deacetylase family protein [Anditalea sp.]|nr:polysaccharide deacetylase family protein [Anditalea sp.]